MSSQPSSHPVLLLSPPAAILATVLLAVSRGSLLLLAIHHVPLLFPSLYNALDHQAMSVPQLERLVFALFVIPELGARLLLRTAAAMAAIDAGVLTIERHTRRHEIPTTAITAAAPLSLPLPWTVLRLRTADGIDPSPGLASADPAALLSALTAGGAGEGVGCAAARPIVPYTSLRTRARGFFEHAVIKFVVFPVIAAVPLFRLRQIVTYGGVFGEYHQFGLQTYLLGFGIYWLLAAVYLLLYAAFLRALVETACLIAARLRRSTAGPVRATAEICQRLAYYLIPPGLIFVRLVVLQ